MTRRTRSRAVLDLPADAVWRVLADLTRWPEWCPGVSYAHLDGPAVVDQTGALGLTMPVVGAVHARTAPPLRVVDVVDGRRMVLEQPQPGGGLRITWELQPEDDGTTTWTQRLDLHGPLSALMAPFVRRALAAEPHLAAVRLHRLAGGRVREDALKVVIAGGAGSLGRRLGADLACRGHEVVVLTRTPKSGLPLRQVAWDGRTVGEWAAELAGPRRVAVVNLAGRLVDARPTPATIEDLARSRVEPTRTLVRASQQLAQPVCCWVQGSTTAIYGDAGERRCTEDTEVTVGLPQMTGVATVWEAALEGANTEHAVVLRTSLVLDRDVPVMDRLLGVTRAGLGGRIGSGRQWMSWIHVEDWLAVVRAALGLEAGVRLPAGVVVAAAPEPVRNAELMSLLRRHLHRPWAPPTPVPLLRAGSVLLRTDPALASTGRHATSRVLAETGFRFRYPRVEHALDDLLG